VTQSSGFASLDNETCEMMVSYARLKPVRDSHGRAVRSVQPGFITWKLPAGVASVASTNVKKMPKPDGLVCKRIESTGSLIARTRQCLTRTEWARQERVTRDEMERLQGKDTIMKGN
jgi:hypothetical protein